MRRRLLAFLTTSALALAVGVTAADHAAAGYDDDRRRLVYEGGCRAGDVSFDIVSNLFGPGSGVAEPGTWSLNPEVENRGTRMAQASVRVALLPRSPRAVPLSLTTGTVPVAPGATSRYELFTETVSPEVEAMFDEYWDWGVTVRATVTAKVRIRQGWRYRWVTYTETCPDGSLYPDRL